LHSDNKNYAERLWQAVTTIQGIDSGQLHVAMEREDDRSW
jgi:hypothetical protein